MLCAPSEPAILRALGLFSPQCEQLGADFLVLGKVGVVAVQRKTCADLVASLRDHRIFDLIVKRTEEVARSVLIVEGVWRWDREGIDPGTGFRRSQFDGLMMSLQEQDIKILHTESLEATAALLPRIERWYEIHDPAKPSSLLTIPKVSVWGDPKDKRKIRALRQYLQVDGVSMGKAIALYDAVGFPVRLTMTGKEIQKAVRGIGPKIATAMEETFGSPMVDTPRTELDAVLADPESNGATTPGGGN